MSEPFLAEIRMVGFTFAPRGWAQCDGQILPINQHQSLYSLLGTTYGGDGRTTFQLPDLRGRSPMHVGSGFSQGQKGGTENEILTIQQIPSHTHDFMTASARATLQRPANSNDSVLAKANIDMYSGDDPDTSLHTNVVGTAGGNRAHENMQPWTAINFCIALQGVFPSRN